MTREDREKLERVELLLDQLQKNVAATYQEIHGILDSMNDRPDLELTWDGSDDDEVDDELMFHMEEIFGEDEDE